MSVRSGRQDDGVGMAGAGGMEAYLETVRELRPPDAGEGYKNLSKLSMNPYHFKQNILILF